MEKEELQATIASYNISYFNPFEEERQEQKYRAFGVGEWERVNCCPNTLSTLLITSLPVQV